MAVSDDQQRSSRRRPRDDRARGRASIADSAGTAQRAPAAASGQWLIVLDPATGRFHVDFPDSGGPAQSQERWLMLAIAVGLDDADFRETVIQTMFDGVLDRASSH